MSHLFIRSVVANIDEKRTNPPGHVFIVESSTPSGPPPPLWSRIVLAFLRLFGYKN